MRQRQCDLPTSLGWPRRATPTKTPALLECPSRFVGVALRGHPMIPVFVQSRIVAFVKIHRGNTHRQRREIRCCRWPTFRKRSCGATDENEDKT